MHKKDPLTQQLVREGTLIEKGFTGLLGMTFPNGTTSQQREWLRNFFFAGAQHLMASIMNVLDEDREPTHEDLMTMSSIDAELKRFIDDFKLTAPTVGNA